MQMVFDNNGRLKYHPDFHQKQGTPWTNQDQRYLIDYYERLGPETLSLDLERTIGTIMTRAYELRKQGVMPKAPESRKNKVRTLKAEAVT